jgi:hypothetical protein
VAFRIVDAEQLEWEEYERFPGRFRAGVTELAGLRHTRANLIRHEPVRLGHVTLNASRMRPSSRCAER